MNNHSTGYKVAIFVSWECYNKLLQNAWLKLTEIYFLIVLGDRSLKSRCWLPLKALGKKSVLPHCYWWLPAILVIPCLIAASFHFLPLLHKAIFPVSITLYVQIPLSL